jgi:hypothetical protein
MMSATVLSPGQFGEDTEYQEPFAAWARQALLATPPAEDEYVHPAAIAMALGGFGLFPSASWVGWAFGYMALLFAVICVLGIMYFLPMVNVNAASTARHFAAK